MSPKNYPFLRALFSLLPLLAVVHACTLSEHQLEGRWQAVAFYENGHSSAALLDSVALVLEPRQYRYRFHSIGRYHEAGRMSTEGNLLLLTDTTVQPHQRRTVQVLFLSADTLKLAMAEDDKEQVLFLTKR